MLLTPTYVSYASDLIEVDSLFRRGRNISGNGSTGRSYPQTPNQHCAACPHVGSVVNRNGCRHKVAFAFETNTKVLTDADRKESVEVSEESIRQDTRP